MAARITEQVPIEFRAGPSEGADGRKGERLFVNYVDPRHAYAWKGLQGEGVPAWAGPVYIYVGDDLVSVLPAAGGERLPEQVSSEDALQLRAEVSRLEGHHRLLQQQVDVTSGQLKAGQEQLASVQTQLAFERERYARETAQLDESLERARQLALAARTQIFEDLKALRDEAGAMRQETVGGVQQMKGLLKEWHEHVDDMRSIEFAEAKHIGARRLKLEQQCTEDMDRYQALAIAPQRDRPSVMENLVTNAVQSGLVSPDFILALVQMYRTGAVPGRPGPGVGGGEGG